MPDRQKDRRTDGQTDRRTDGQTDRRTDGQTDRSISMPQDCIYTELFEDKQMLVYLRVLWDRTYTELLEDKPWLIQEFDF